jgi:hypothetical protein
MIRTRARQNKCYKAQVQTQFLEDYYYVHTLSFMPWRQRNRHAFVLSSNCISIPISFAVGLQDHRAN